MPLNGVQKNVLKVWSDFMPTERRYSIVIVRWSGVSGKKHLSPRTKRRQSYLQVVKFLENCRVHFVICHNFTTFPTK